VRVCACAATVRPGRWGGRRGQAGAETGDMLREQVVRGEDGDGPGWAREPRHSCGHDPQCNGCIHEWAFSLASPQMLMLLCRFVLDVLPRMAP